MPAAGPWKILVQAGHNPPRQPGKTATQTGTNGEIEFVKKVRDAVVALLRRDPHFEPIPMPGAIPWGFRCDAAIFLHADGAGPTATGISFGFDEHYPVNKRLADLIWHEFESIPGHPGRRSDNCTKDEHFYYGFRLVDTPGPETLIEHGFLTNRAERQWMNAN